VVGGKRRFAAQGWAPQTQRHEALRLVLGGIGEVAVDADTPDQTISLCD